MIGTIASIAGALIAIYAAVRSKKYSVIALEAKSALKAEYGKFELREVLRQVKEAMKQSRKLNTGPSRDGQLTGVDYSGIVESLREVNDVIKEHVHYLSGAIKTDVEDKVEELDGLLSMHANTSQQDMNKVGDEIHKCLGKLMQGLKQASDI